MARLNINIQEGTLEVEGEESFVAGVYADFKEQLAAGAVARSARAEAVRTIEPEASKQQKATKKSRPAGPKETFTIVRDLDLSAKRNTQSLRDFYAIKKPGSSMEHNAVFVYYLQTIVGVKAITLDHVYSCYKDVGAKIPALRSSLLNTAFAKGYVDTSSLESIKLTTPGENLVEQDLPRKDA